MAYERTECPTRDADAGLRFVCVEEEKQGGAGVVVLIFGIAIGAVGCEFWHHLGHWPF
jgi:hypothetical protein